VVHFVIWHYDAVPIIDHCLVHMIDVFEARPYVLANTVVVIDERQNVSVCEVCIADYEDVRQCVSLYVV
jgi:hypothetical protein